MRASGRIFFSLHGFLFFSLILVPIQISHGQTASAATASRLSTQDAQQAGVPDKWNDAVKTLAGKIAVAVKPSRVISLDVKNISSLGSAEVEAIREALAAELTSRGIRLASGEPRVDVTLSENTERYVWVVALRREGNHDGDSNVEIISGLKTPDEPSIQSKESLLLSRRLIWQQSAPFLDFTVFYGLAGAQFSTLLILEGDRLVYYEAKNGGWYLKTTLTFPHSEPVRRDPTGGISAERNIVRAPGIQCTGELRDPAKVECGLWKETILWGPYISPKIPERDTRAEGGLLSDRCGNSSIDLVSGNGDWTQTDSIQGYLVADIQAEAVASGSPLEFDGPVTAMRGDANSLRVIVRNLRTSNYEGYIVTATCSH